MVVDRTAGYFPPPGNCSNCRQPITDTTQYVWWSLPDGYSLRLHARCAARLSLHLASDALKADLPPNGAHQLGYPSEGWLEITEPWPLDDSG